MATYLKGPHGYRIAYNKQDLARHEKDGYKVVDMNEELLAKSPPKEKQAEAKSKPVKKKSK